MKRFFATAGFVMVAALLFLAPSSAVEPNAQVKFSNLIGNVTIVGTEGDVMRTTADKPEEINSGGLVIVQVHDQGSAPVEIKDVEKSESFELVGQVRGVGIKDGHRLMGGGYTWLMFRAGDKLGNAKITFSYETAPHAGGKVKKETQFLTVVANE